MHKICARVSVFIGFSIYSFKRYTLTSNLPHSISGCFLGGFVGISESHMLHVLQHMGDMRGAVVQLVAHHRRMLALGDAAILEGLIDHGFFGHF